MSAVAEWATPLKQFILLFTGWDELDYKFSTAVAAVIAVVLLASAIVNPVMWLGIGGLAFWIVVQLAAFRFEIWAEMRYLKAVGEPHDYDTAAARARKKGWFINLLGIIFTCVYCAFLLIAGITFILSAIGI